MNAMQQSFLGVVLVKLDVQHDTEEQEVVEKEKRMTLDVHNKGTLRSMLSKEFDYWQREAVRIDSNNSHDDY